MEKGAARQGLGGQFLKEHSTLCNLRGIIGPRLELRQPAVKFIFTPALGIFLVQFPRPGISSDVFPDAVEGFIITNHLLIKTPLPYGFTRRIAYGVDFIGNSGFKSPNNGG
jgi:hypothetical protein